MGWRGEDGMRGVEERGEGGRGGTQRQCTTWPLSPIKPLFTLPSLSLFLSSSNPLPPSTPTHPPGQRVHLQARGSYWEL